jgi:hypothetical protein
MKKKYLTYAGIISALILVGMFIAICLSQIPFPFLPPTTTMDPVTDASVDQDNMMILTGTTTLPSEFTLLFITVNASPPFLSQGNATGTPETRGDANLIAEPNRWKGTVNISRLQPGDYTITLWKFTVDENFKMNESHPVATQHFTLIGADAGGRGVHKKQPRVPLPFIRINPADQQTAAEHREISGITSLVPGTLLTWSMHTVSNGTGNSKQEYQGITPVFSGIQGVNRWAVLPGTGNLKPARYQFYITGNPIGNASPAGTISATSEFDIPPVPGTLQNTTGIPQVPREFITIDSLPDMRTNDRYVITGTTSFPAGDALLFQIIPASFISDYNFSFDSRGNQATAFSGITGMTEIMNGSSGTNLWSVDVNTYSMIPARYEVNVSNNRYEFNRTEMVYGTVFSSQIITVGGDPI